MTSFKISKKADLENLIGKKLTKALCESINRPSHKRLPQSISFTESKQSFALDDGSTLTALALDIGGERILGKHYCGSADSAIHHQAEQFSEGYTPPEGAAVAFIESYWNGRNMSWAVTVVTPNIPTDSLGVEFKEQL